MSTMSQRIFAASGAILFFITSIALSVVVVVTIIQDNKQAKEEKAAISTQQTAEGKLQGTKLAGFTPVESVAELQSTDAVPGTGAEVTSVDQQLSIDYTGAVAKDGTIFQSSKDSGQPLDVKLSGVIEGWQKGVIGMKEGGTRRLVIPAELAYGAAPPQGSGIPSNAALVFDITLHKVGQ